MQSNFTGNLAHIRDIEDCIRITRKYTKGAFAGLFRKKTPAPLQGEDFPSRVVTEYYEVYPDLNVRDGAFWDLPAGTAIDWLWGDTVHIDVVFRYDYRENKATMMVRGGPEAIRQLSQGIPGFSKALSSSIEDTNSSSSHPGQVTENCATAKTPVKSPIENNNNAH